MLIDFDSNKVFDYLESSLEKAHSYECLQRLIGVIDSFVYFGLITSDLNYSFRFNIEKKLDSFRSLSGDNN